MSSSIIILILLNISYFIHNVVSENAHSKLEIAKCCGEKEVVFMDPLNYTVKCVNYSTTPLTFTNAKVYDKDVHEKPIEKSFLDVFRVVLNKRPTKKDFEENYFDVKFISEPYLSEDGLLYLEYPNAYQRWSPINNSFYCVDYELQLQGSTDSTKSSILSKNFIFWCGNFGGSPKPTSKFFTAALLVSVIFLSLVLIVYTLLPGLRNLGGMVLMAYIFSLLFAFLFLSVIQIQQHEPDTCIGLTTVVYFFFLASFCWMNVMSYDIWWTFRGYAKARPIHRRGETFKFRMYCIYGWGIPLAMSIAFVIINNTDMLDMPWFVKPMVPVMGCFIEGGQKLVYLYAPMLILILCNWMFFLMTAFNIWRLNRGTAVLDSPAAGTPQAHRSQRNRFFIYLKLSIIMGINWILEVASSLTPDLEIWYITDAYNLLIGLAIFLIFVCKKKIYRELKSRFTKNQMPQRTLTKSQTSCTTLSTSSQDTPLQVFQHPNGNSVRR